MAGGTDKLQFVVMASQEAVEAGANAGLIVRDAAKVAGGGGGGKPAMAQAGGRDAAKVPAALEKAKELIRAQLRA